MTDEHQIVCLTIAGLDPSGGAGILADIKTFAALGCFGAAAVTSLTFQNTTGVFGAEHSTAETVRRQVQPVFDDYEVAAVKTGMLPTHEVILATAELIKTNDVKHLVVDPVVRSTSGYDLIDDKALRSLIKALFPLAEVITPNIPEAERITGITIRNTDDIKSAAAAMHDLGARGVLIKGGHLEDRTRSTDHLFVDGDYFSFDAERIATTATHGTGCTLSAAIAANLALGNELKESVKIAKKFVTDAIRTAPNVGRGHSPINHLTRP